MGLLLILAIIGAIVWSRKRAVKLPSQYTEPQPQPRTRSDVYGKAPNLMSDDVLYASTPPELKSEYGPAPTTSNLGYDATPAAVQQVVYSLAPSERTSQAVVYDSSLGAAPANYDSVPPIKT